VDTSTATTAGQVHSYIKFDLAALPVGVTITAVTLNMVVPATGTDGTQQTVLVYTTDSGWNEGSLTWANRPALGSQVGSLPTVLDPDPPGTTTTPVSASLATSTVGGPGPLALALAYAGGATHSDGIDFFSKEGQAPGPCLSVTYTDTVVPPTAVPTQVPTTAPGDTPVPTIAPVATAVPRPGADMVAIPSWAVGGKVLAWTHVYYAALQGAAGVEELGPGTSIWVFGLDSTEQFYLAMLAGKKFWLPVGVVGPNYESPWFGRPLPTEIVDGTGALLK
jgi:hypothetical protein